MITFDEEKRLFKLDTAASTYVIEIYRENYLLNLYYGQRIYGEMNFLNMSDRNPNASFSPVNPSIGEYGFSPDSAPMEYGCNGAGDFRISALSIRNVNGDSVTDIRYREHKIYNGKPELPGLPSTYVNSDDEAQTLEIVTEDKVTGAVVTLFYTVFEKYCVMTRSVKVENTSKAPMNIERIFSCCVDLPSMDYDLISLYGKHACERFVERRALAHGIQGIQSKRGSSSHSHNPFIALAGTGADEDKGEVFGFNLVYSGNFSAMVECDYNKTSRIIMGINPTDFDWLLEWGESFYSPEVVCVYSAEGLGEMSRTFHSFYNNNLIRGKYKTEKRPLLINSWEAAYFDFDSDKLVEFAQVAKELGIEMLVMDDGWFGKRNDDTNSLGDWFVNEEKLPGGLKPLIQRVNDLGLKFGIWYEPEMISPDSELYRAHPDWCVHVQGREPMLGRHQYVLDFSREDVRENIWQQMYAVLSQNNIDYLKWDFNRNISDAGSALLPAERKKEFFHRFVLGTYDIMGRLVTTFPNLLLENCSGGGGRFDPAMLTFSPQIWTSDNTDAISRVDIQFGTSLCYPASCQSAHVSSSSRTSYETKGNVAMWGTFGYELDPRKLTDEDRKTVIKQVEEYHRNYWLIRNGDLYRLINPYDDSYKAAWEFVSKDKSQALVTVVYMREELHRRLFLKIKGLAPDKMYKEENSGQIYSGDFLMKAGINFGDKGNCDGGSFTLYFTEIK